MNQVLSRKILLPLAGILIVALNRKLSLGLTAADVATIAGIIVGAVLGIAYHDAAMEGAILTPHVEAPKPPTPPTPPARGA